MAGHKYNWKKLEKEWLTGEYKSLIDFSKDKKIPYNSIIRYSKKWNKKELKLTARAEEKTAELLADMRVRHIANGKRMAILGMETLEHDEMNVAEAIQAVRTGSEIERKILQPNDEAPHNPVTIVFQALSSGMLKRPVIVEAIDVTPVNAVVIAPSIARPIEKISDSAPRTNPLNTDNKGVTDA
jgi:hypothetical protein